MNSLDDIILDLEKKLERLYKAFDEAEGKSPFDSSPHQCHIQEGIDMLEESLRKVKLKKGNKRNG